MTDQKTELGLGIDLDLSEHKIKQGSNNIMYVDQTGRAVFPGGIDLNNSGIHIGNTFLFRERDRKMEMKSDFDLAGKKVWNRTDEIWNFENGNMKLYKGLNLNGNAIIDGENVLFVFRDNRINLLQNFDLNGKDIIGQSFIIEGGILGNIVPGEYQKINIGKYNSFILFSFNLKIYGAKTLNFGDETQNRANVAINHLRSKSSFESFFLNFNINTRGSNTPSYTPVTSATLFKIKFKVSNNVLFHIFVCILVPVLQFLLANSAARRFC